MVLSPNEFTGTLPPDDVPLTTLTTTSAFSTAENDISNDPHLTQASILSPNPTSYLAIATKNLPSTQNNR
ncbi:hypothetical protein G6F61_011102 [Rhizopus arrhizus]|nr:hypothetical protein G6F23_007946 [Rhizopus arrhizus]KAG1372385.1 hypothetical protein G6F61_011102 [Rhizopus arrhizus]